jgi:sulfur-carrier protein
MALQSKRVELQYFAILRESAGKTAETRDTQAMNLADLYEELRQQYSFSLDADRIRAAVDQRYVPLETPLTDGMNITFIPPVAGG